MTKYSTLRIGFADSLKIYLNEKYKDLNINFFEPKDKETKRLIMVGTANYIRDVIDHRFWIKKLDEKVQEVEAELIFIPDLRFCQYEDDELSYIHAHGTSIYLDREGSQPASEPEKQNNPKLKELCRETYVLPEVPGDLPNYYGNLPIEYIMILYKAANLINTEISKTKDPSL